LPTLVVIEPKNGRIITHDGTNDVQDANAALEKWRKELQEI
jgi:hypothetical protein